MDPAEYWPKSHYKKTDQVREVEAILGFEFEHVYDPEKFFWEEYPKSYHDVMNPVREMIKDAHGGHVFLGENQEIRGINLYARTIQTENLNQLLALDLPHLQCLNLNETGITFYRFTDKQPNLIFINLSQNENLTRVEFEYTPKELVSLDMYDSGVGEIHIPEGMDNLVKIDIARNKLKSFTFGSGIRDLYLMDLGNNEIEEIHFPSGFQELRRVSFYQNKLKSFSFEGVMPNIESFDFRGNQLTDLPDNILSLGSLQELYLGNNPWERIADAVKDGDRDNSRENIFSFLASIADTEETENLYEAKMILVGNGMVGKTSIRTRLINPTAKLPEKDDRTQGLDVDYYTIEKLSPAVTGLSEEIDFTLNIWDFGGQGRYREIQQLFCSHKSLYLFVTSYDDVPEKNENYVGFDYWLQMITAYGYDPIENINSPVAVVINKIDIQRPLFTFFDSLKERFPNIYPDVLKVSANTLKNFDDLEEAIFELIPKISKDILETKRNVKWLEVKNELENRKEENYISLDTYHSICDEKGLSKTEANTWLNMLNRIGSLIYFSEEEDFETEGRGVQSSVDLKLSNWVILRPEWVREAMYRAIDSPILRGGILRHTDLGNVWPEYTEEEKEQFLKMILAYRLGYQREDNWGNKEYVIPACLHEAPPVFPDLLQKDSDTLRPMLSEHTYDAVLEFSPFIPAGTLNKLMVEVGRVQRFQIYEDDLSSERKEVRLSVYNNLMWKDHVVLHDATTAQNAFALLTEDWESKKIHICLKGDRVAPILEGIISICERLNRKLKYARYLKELKMDVFLCKKGDKEWRKLEIIKEKGELIYKHEFMSKIVKLVEQARFEEAIEDLSKKNPSRPLSLLKVDYSQLKDKKLSGLITAQEYRVQLLQIADRILELAKE